jgi:hypothetical protein
MVVWFTYLGITLWWQGYVAMSRFFTSRWTGSREKERHEGSRARYALQRLAPVTTWLQLSKLPPTSKIVPPAGNQTFHT